MHLKNAWIILENLRDKKMNNKFIKIDITICPQCGSDNYEKTLMGCIKDKDSNLVRCLNCGWKGTFQDWKDIQNLRIKYE